MECFECPNFDEHFNEYKKTEYRIILDSLYKKVRMQVLALCYENMKGLNLKNLGSKSFPFCQYPKKFCLVKIPDVNFKTALEKKLQIHLKTENEIRSEINGLRLNILPIKLDMGIKIKEAKDIVDLMKIEANADRELFWIIHLNKKNKVIEKELISMGGLSHAIVHPREVFKNAILNSSDSIITVHNHPSDDPIPSPEDRNVWKMLSEAGELIKIKVKDNLIICPTGKYYSQMEKEN